MNQNDELGEISQAVNTMQNAIKGIIKNVINVSGQVAATAQQLTATSQETSVSANEVARVIEGIAHGALEQAKDTEQGTTSILELGDLVMENNKMIEELNISTGKVNTLKDDGLEILANLVEKTDLSNNSAGRIQEVGKIVTSQTESVGMTDNKFRGIAEAIEEMKEVIYKFSTLQQE